ncbi:MAG: chromate efflux transporter [Gammaproteobacteria bacterium]|nr:chromate efflux transporter [Gammaproteobacteria bacterium]
MKTSVPIQLQQHWREITGVFLKLGALSYGGPAIMGMMQTELQEKRGWLSKEGFMEGLALVNMLPGAGATQLGIFLGFIRGGWWGGLLAGLCFVLPAFLIMFGLTWAYSRYGALPSMRGVFYGLTSIVVGIFSVAVWRLGKAAIRDRKQSIFALASALLLALTPVNLVPILLLAGALGIVFYGTRRWGVIATVLILIGYGIVHWSGMGSVTTTSNPSQAANLGGIAIFFFKVGAFSFGGGLSMLAFMQEQVVNQLHWLTQQQFLDGLALGQLTPGPILMVAAFVGYQKASLVGALAAALAIFLPSFVLMLAVLPVYEPIKRVVWMKAALKGISPAVIGMIAIAMIQMLPKTVVDWPSGILFITTIGLLYIRYSSPLPLMLAGGLIGWIINS